MLQKNGLSLLELILVMAVSTLLIFSSVSGWHYWQHYQLKERTISLLQQALFFAKQTAMAQRTTVYICPASDDIAQCGTNWTKGLFIFTHTTLLLQVPPISTSSTLFWRGFSSKPLLQFLPDGMPHGTHGTFYFIDAGKEIPLVTLNSIGRIRANSTDDNATAFT